LDRRVVYVPVMNFTARFLSNPAQESQLPERAQEQSTTAKGITKLFGGGTRKLSKASQKP
jgi:hypothetical protein